MWWQWTALAVFGAALLWYATRVGGREKKRLEALSPEELKRDGWHVR